MSGTHVIYVLHDIDAAGVVRRAARQSADSSRFTVWKRLAKPVALLLGLLAAPVAFFHYVTEGPKEPQPPEETGHGG